ncbi:hypothetical protein [Arthrobacter sp. A5]|uniref:hypothetical protein n=1 Tax=Arthrobacter sp. A5 TaxID=576926 RepID=UPI003DA9ED50
MVPFDACAFHDAGMVSGSVGLCRGTGRGCPPSRRSGRQSRTGCHLLGHRSRLLEHQIDIRLHECSGKAITNFKATLPPSDSDLVQQLTKDPYVFDFVSMTDQHNERDLEAQLVIGVDEFFCRSALLRLQASPVRRRRAQGHQV